MKPSWMDVDISNAQTIMLQKDLVFIKSTIEEELKKYSTAIAEATHHVTCSLPCCGAHTLDVPSVEPRCTKCGLSEYDINEHNMQWWNIVDSVENNDICSDMFSVIEKLEEQIAELEV